MGKQHDKLTYFFMMTYVWLLFTTLSLDQKAFLLGFVFLKQKHFTMCSCGTFLNLSHMHVTCALNLIPPIKLVVAKASTPRIGGYCML